MQTPGTRFRFLAVAALLTVQLSGCGIGYYWQATQGHLGLMNQRRPIPEVVDDPDTSPETRTRLALASRAVEFAHSELLLPDNGSYGSYVDTGNRYVVWNVFAAPEFSLDATTWCFPVAGCVSYRGYFNEAAAQKFAAGLAGNGDDIWVGGVTAYSTLGRFEDPVLNTMIVLPDHRLAGLIFHELAHQRVYVKGDSKFNEGFANFVEQEGIRRWLTAAEKTDSMAAYGRMLARRAEVHTVIAETRLSLEALYAKEIGSDEKRIAKQEILNRLGENYAELRREWIGPPDFDHWFKAQFNNARLSAMATYDDYVPAFAEMLNRHDGDLEAFYAQVTALAQLDSTERTGRLLALAGNP